MIVGIPTELNPKEQRVAATPKTVQRLIKKQGFEVVIQKGAGVSANYSDEEFTAAGAKMLDTAAEVYSSSEIILKVQPVTTELILA